MFNRMLDTTQREKAFLQQELNSLTRMFVSLVRSLSEAVKGDSSPTESVNGAEHDTQPLTMPLDLSAILHGNASLLDAHEQPPVSSCVVQHPGALCCTSTSIAKDAKHKVAIINLRTVARLSDDPEAHQSLTMDDLTGLATQAMSNSANDVCREHARTLNRAVLGTDRLEMHQKLCNTLQSGSIVKVCDYAVSQFGHKSFKLQLCDAKTGHTYVAVVRPLTSCQPIYTGSTRSSSHASTGIPTAGTACPSNGWPTSSTSCSAWITCRRLPTFRTWTSRATAVSRAARCCVRTLGSMFIISDCYTRVTPHRLVGTRAAAAALPG